MVKGAGVCERTKEGFARMVTIDGGLPGFGSNVTQPLVRLKLVNKKRLVPNRVKDLIASTPQSQLAVARTMRPDFDRLVGLVGQRSLMYYVLLGLHG
jgi:hypothetical protein